MNHYIKKYSEILQTTTPPRKDSSLSQRPASVTPAPLSFLNNLSPQNKKLITATEEILSQVHDRFYEKAKSSRSSSPISFNSPNPFHTSTQQSTSPHRFRKYKKMSPSLSPMRNYNIFPTLSPSKDKIERLSKPSLEQNNSKFFKIDLILKACEDESGKMIENSKKIKQFIGKERVVALNYVKEMEWASDKLNEINGYDNNLMKKLFEEHKSTNIQYENDKVKVSKKYKVRSLLDCKSNAKAIKKLLLNYKLKVMP
ncbi:hypothetical protein SteCoe_23575 [Stentor coeruleus]|uniref:Uncharacterized protein n=1 Tax=Stentor coeruleus TaxID=5963 RepID=A0A1R2BJK4_9CILI|nr:hypothetical protein SteCoe_23575 [Stentor coeruleus]